MLNFLFPLPATTSLIRGTILALGAAFFAVHLRAAPDSPPSGVRTDIVLKVGPVEVSRYLVEKNLARFQRAGNGGRSPSALTARRWLELYLARQVIIAEALSQGYAQRSEVLGMVDTMERHMLAQAEPPVAPPTEVELHAAYDQMEAPRGAIKPPFGEARSLLERKLEQDRRLAHREATRNAAGQTLELEIVHGTAEKLFQRIRTGSPSLAEIPEQMVLPLAGELLATYHLAGQTVTLTGEAWRKRFNQLFVREIPTSVAQLESGIQDMAIADYAVQHAHERGLDREARFVEDRRNFLYHQALDLFEKERLRSQVEVTDVETEAYYRAHAAEFARPVRARGTLLRFPDSAAALAWLRHRESAVAAGEEVEVSPHSPLPGAAGATDHLLRLADGEPSGPINAVTGVIIFLKRSTVTEPESYAAVAARIRATLAQPRLEALELGLAREWASRHVIEDRLHPEEFGIVGPVESPWSGPNKQ